MIQPTHTPGHIDIVPIPVPIATVITYVGNITASPTDAPQNYTLNPEANGWMLCDGRSLKPSEYPELFSALGYLYGGSGDAFNLPNLQGQFLRGVSATNAAVENRTKAQGGTDNGVGSTQPFAMQTHVHTYTAPNEPTPTAVGDKAAPVVVSNNPQTATGTPEQSVTQSPGNVNVSQYETRPDNVFIYYLIKYTSNLPGFMLTQPK